MDIGILSFLKKSSRAELRIAAEAKARGHKVKMLKHNLCSLTFDGKGKIGFQYGKSKFKKPDLIIPRPNLHNSIHTRMAVIEQLELMGIPLLNSHSSILRAKSKLKTLQILSHYNIPVVKTMVLNGPGYIQEAVEFIGNFPIIIKTIFGSQGQGVAIVESDRSVKSTYGLLEKSVGGNNVLLLQEYIAEADGKDVRLFVVGGEVIAAMERVAKDGDFRSNVGQGGNAVEYKPTEEEVHLAIRAAKAMNLEIAGVDIIKTKHGPAIMEVNANPGFTALEPATGVNIAGAIIEYAERFVHEYVPTENI